MDNVAIIGAMRSGKDSVASFLIDMLGYHRIAFADALKKEACAALSAVSDRSYTPADLDADRPRFRPLLQWWGTEFRRADDEDYWVKKVTQELDGFRNRRPIVVTDARFSNELDMLVARGFKVIRLDISYRELRTYLINQGMTDAEVDSQLEHPSEQAWRTWDEVHGVNAAFASTHGNLPALTSRVVEALGGATTADIAQAYFALKYPDLYGRAA